MRLSKSSKYASGSGVERGKRMWDDASLVWSGRMMFNFGINLACGCGGDWRTSTYLLELLPLSAADLRWFLFVHLICWWIALMLPPGLGPGRMERSEDGGWRWARLSSSGTASQRSLRHTPLILGKARKAVRQFPESALIQLVRARTAMARYHRAWSLPCTGELVHLSFGMADSGGIIGQPWPAKLK